ncbi:hypothetical protein OAL58_06940 [Verrucomicrobia bacterium]|nr:hypothetical protein [Verrucomicrobiota bacterium]
MFAIQHALKLWFATWFVKLKVMVSIAPTGANAYGVGGLQPPYNFLRFSILKSFGGGASVITRQ